MRKAGRRKNVTEIREPFLSVKYDHHRNESGGWSVFLCEVHFHNTTNSPLAIVHLYKIKIKRGDQALDTL